MALGPGEKAVTARIRGEVQGVWFRSWTVEEATRRGLRGWVRNRRDGSVEALFAGPAAAVDGMVAACRKGPPLARVAEVETSPADESPPGFRQIPSA
ncbi:MAG: acylphosphatase [Dongiaceae bacterium]